MGSRQLPIALRVGAVALWIVFLIGMVNWSNTYAAVVGAGVGTVALGLLVGRWWVLLVAVVPGALVALGVLVSDPDDYYEGSPGSTPRPSQCWRSSSPPPWRWAWRSIAPWEACAIVDVTQFTD